jgi:hypothetical protein
MTPAPLPATAATAARNSALAFQGSRTYVQTVQTASHRGGSAALVQTVTLHASVPFDGLPHGTLFPALGR